MCAVRRQKSLLLFFPVCDHVPHFVICFASGTRRIEAPLITSFGKMQRGFLGPQPASVGETSLRTGTENRKQPIEDHTAHLEDCLKLLRGPGDERR